MKSQAYRMALLYDFYGDVLTERQKEFYDLYYNEDLSLSEIAENSGITRQGVRDVIVRAEAILTDLEDKTGLIKRFHAMHKQLQQIAEDAEKILERNGSYDDPDIEAAAREIRELAQAASKGVTMAFEGLSESSPAASKAAGQGPSLRGRRQGGYAGRVRLALLEADVSYKGGQAASSLR